MHIVQKDTRKMKVQDSDIRKAINDINEKYRLAVCGAVWLFQEPTLRRKVLPSLSG
jgi:hypothetical protein